jgi:hypothetical protein
VKSEKETEVELEELMEAKSEQDARMRCWVMRRSATHRKHRRGIGKSFAELEQSTPGRIAFWILSADRTRESLHRYVSDMWSRKMKSEWIWSLPSLRYGQPAQ